MLLLGGFTERGEFAPKKVIISHTLSNDFYKFFERINFLNGIAHITPNDELV